MFGRRIFLIGMALTGASVVLAQGVALAQGSDSKFPFETLWVAESLGGTKFAPVSRPSLRISRDGRVSGTTGCNRFGGRVATLSGTSISFQPLAMTKMACFGAGGDNERMFAPAIGTATQWRFERRMLVIDTAQGPMRLRRR